MKGKNMKYSVVKDSLTKDGNFIKRGTTVELSDEVAEKLLKLGNIEKYEIEENKPIKKGKDV
jgi:hypothetical protein